MIKLVTQIISNYFSIINLICTFNKELKGINWSQYIDGSAMLNLPLGQTVPTGFTVGHSYFLGLNNVRNFYHFIP